MKKCLLVLCLLTGLASLTQAQDTPKDTTLKEYVGKYLFPSGSVIAEVSITLAQDGTLTSSSTAGVSELVKKEKDLFDVPRFQGTARFNRDSNGKVVGISVNASGYQLEGTKSPDSTSLPSTAYLYHHSSHPRNEQDPLSNEPHATQQVLFTFLSSIEKNYWK